MSTNNLLADATRFVLREKRFSLIQIQHKFKIEHSESLALRDQLAMAGVLEEPNPSGHFHVNCGLLPQSIEKKDPVYIHALTLRNLAAYLIEHDGYQSTYCIKLLTEPCKYENNYQELKNLTKEIVAGTENPVLALALRLADTSAMAKKIAPSLTRNLVQELCSQFRISMPDRSDSYEMRLNGLKHAMRYLLVRLHQTGQTAGHSRIFELFIHKDLLPATKAHDVLKGIPIHREHVVPCALLRDKAFELLQHGIPEDEVALWIEPFIRIVTIKKSDASELDGPMKLKYKMPDRWAFGSGCIYERLHRKNIPFTIVAGDTQCLCR